ncbi:MAG: CDP-alcohol phosphatidyltransferase family protein [Sphingomonadales bacterium]|jgi:cardiolipin synthase
MVSDNSHRQELSTLSYFTLPNLLCYSRILLTPVIVYFLVEAAFFEALIVFFLAGLSDAVDGPLARLFNQTSLFGKFLDPIADKIFVNAVFITCAVIAILPWWFAALVLLRDVLFALAYAWSRIRKRKSDVTPVGISKANTFLQVVLGLTVMGEPLIGLDLRQYIWAVVSFVTITSAISAMIYLRRWVVLMQMPLK